MLLATILLAIEVAENEPALAAWCEQHEHLLAHLSPAGLQQARTARLRRRAQLNTMRPRVE